MLRYCGIHVLLKPSELDEPATYSGSVQLEESELVPQVFAASGTWVGRVERAGTGPSVVTVRNNILVDISSSAVPTVRDLLEQDNAAQFAASCPGTPLGAVDKLPGDITWLAPCDLQPIKACGVTFARSMVERVIEERARGDPLRADEIRDRIGARIGKDLRDVEPGSDDAEVVKQTLIAEGLWSQYLEVGIGPFAEVFTKALPLSAVGHGASVGLHSASIWNNPEPEVVLAVNSSGVIKAATLGNDVNLRDIEGRSALLLPLAKDNNASCAIGPMLRLFDAGFNLACIRDIVLKLRIEGKDGYRLDDTCSMAEISRSPTRLVAQTIGRHHQYPDGFMLFLGTLFAPTEDRDQPGEGFTHKPGDRVSISCRELGTLTNTVRLSTECPPWRFGAAALMRNLSARGLI